MKHPWLTFPKPGTPVCVTTKRPGRPTLKFQGEYQSAGLVRLGFLWSDLAYVHLLVFLHVDANGNSQYRSEHIPLRNVKDVEVITHLDGRAP